MSSTTEGLSSGEQRQLQLEDEGLHDGIDAYRKRTTKHTSNESEYHSDYGKALVVGSIEPVERAILQFLADAKTKPGCRHSAVRHLEMIEPDVAAFIAARCITDGISTIRMVQAVALRIGGRLEDEVRFSLFERLRGGLYRTVNATFDKSPWSYNTRRRRTTLAHAAAKFGVEHAPWSRSEKFHVGMKLIELFVTCTELAQLRRSTAVRDTRIYIEPTPKLSEWIDGYKARSEMLSPFLMPMVCPPRPWTTPSDGGYLAPVNQANLVKRRSRRDYKTRQMPAIYDGVNALQQTPWTINRPVLTVVKEIWGAGMEVKGMPRRHDLPLPAKPADYETNKPSRSAWKLEAANIFRANQEAVAKRMLTAKVMHLARKFADYPAIWFPVQLDSRGRVYLMPEYLNPQGSDLAKSLLTFAEGKPLGEQGAFWLGIHLANTFGYDKCSLQERYDWAVSNSDHICRTATEPFDARWWTEADKPFQFLAAAIEWKGYQSIGYDYVSSLPIMVDGSCNGLQHFSAMLRDDVCGRQVNLVPQQRPADIYAAVADVLKDRLAEEATKGGETAQWASQWLAYGIDRKLCKKPVMILPYGGTRSSFQKYLLESVAERQNEGRGFHPFGRDLVRATNFLTTLIIQVMDTALVGPRQAMNWLRDVAKTVTRADDTIGWTTPSGFYVKQKYLDKESRRVKTKVGDKVVMLTLAEESDRVDKRKHSRSMAANFVHSMDASALILTICAAKARGVHRFAAVHDSYGTLATDMQLLMDCLRETFVKMYEENDVLEQLRVEVGSAGSGIALPPIPSKGSLDLRGVLRSDFFFA